MSEVVEYSDFAEIFVPIATKSEANIRQHWAVKARRVKLQAKTFVIMRLPAVAQQMATAPRHLEFGAETGQGCVRQGVMVLTRHPRPDKRF